MKVSTLNNLRKIVAVSHDVLRSYTKKLTHIVKITILIVGLLADGDERGRKRVREGEKERSNRGDWKGWRKRRRERGRGWSWSKLREM